jgi:two-component system response regulator AtoC
MSRILVIDDDPDILDNILELLEAEGFEGVGAGDGKVGVSAALANPPALIVCDIGMPVMDGFQVLQAIRDYPETSAVPFIFLTAWTQRSDIRQGMNLGADDYLTKPFSRAELLAAIRSRLARHQHLTADAPVQSPVASSGDDAGPIVCAPALQAVYDEALRAARTDLAVLLLGETGVGKDVLAHAIHKASPRAGHPFVPLNCAALSEGLVDSELFGHEKGAFTGASTQRSGLFETADGGTVFLDEIGDLPLSTQVKLLRVLETRQVMRVGGRAYRDINVRFVSATHHNLEAESESGRFRLDLFYRIGVIVLTVPPLRERQEDIAPLATRFARGMSRRMGRTAPVQLSSELIGALEAWSWPGNVRELRNTIERCVALSQSDEIGLDLLPVRLRHPEIPPGRSSLKDEVRRQQRRLEREQILRALEENSWNQTRTARALGISRRTLINRLDEYNLPRPRK